MHLLMTEIMRNHVHANYINHDMYPKTYEMELRMVRMLNELWNGSKGVEPSGTVCIGSSDACMLAGAALCGTGAGPGGDRVRGVER
jgi:glutamate decarboxylase